MLTESQMDSRRDNGVEWGVLPLFEGRCTNRRKEAEAADSATAMMIPSNVAKYWAQLIVHACRRARSAGSYNIHTRCLILYSYNGGFPIMDREKDTMNARKRKAGMKCSERCKKGLAMILCVGLLRSTRILFQIPYVVGPPGTPQQWHPSPPTARAKPRSRAWGSKTGQPGPQPRTDKTHLARCRKMSTCATLLSVLCLRDTASGCSGATGKPIFAMAARIFCSLRT